MSHRRKAPARTSAGEAKRLSHRNLDRLAATFVQLRMSQPSTTEQKPLQNSPSTLGDVLYAKLKPKVLERDWAALVQSIASGDELALHALYRMSHRFVFTLAMRITANRETAEEVTLDVFHRVAARVGL